MKKYGLLGDKLGHSFSPAIHKMLADYEYDLYEVEADKVAHFMQTTELEGFTVTMPYKETVIPYCSELSPRAKAIGCVNTVFRRADGTFYADNTDYYGFEYLLGVSLSKNGTFVQPDCSGKKAIVLGSGGASKTVRTVLRDCGADVTIISRSGENNYSNIDKHYDADIIVNTTPVGMYPHNGFSAVELSGFTKCSLVLDVVYNPEKTEIILQAEDLGIPAFSGLRMLVAQAKAAAEHFTGTKIDDSEVERIFNVISTTTKNIVLLGMPGCGKSSIGARLAELIGRKLVDTDALIEEKSNRTIPEIIKTDGEAAFRKLETEVLAEACKQSGVIIATGGGIVTIPENRRLIRQNGVAVFIQRDITELPTYGRPLSQTKGVEQIYDERLPLYLDWADIKIENTSIDDAAEEIRKELKL